MDKPMLSESQAERYARHILLPEIGVDGQRRLLAGRVLVIGAGGLGSPAALYLAAAGAGSIGLVDDDHVELSNLQRQIIHSMGDIGCLKVNSAAARIAAMNSDVRVQCHPMRVVGDNLLALLEDYDFIIDGTDNFAAKFLINDICVRANKPFSHGGIARFCGQTLTVLPHRSACFRCLFEEPPAAGEAPDCSSQGVLGALPGVIGALQATEALKYLLGTGTLLTDRLMTYDALGLKFREVPVAPNPLCSACSATT